MAPFKENRLFGEQTSKQVEEASLGLLQRGVHIVYEVELRSEWGGECPGV